MKVRFELSEAQEGGPDIHEIEVEGDYVQMTYDFMEVNGQRVAWFSDGWWHDEATNRHWSDVIVSSIPEGESS